MKSLLLLATALLPQLRAQPASCSCSPTQYTFRLDLSADCDSSTISEELDGINGSLCFFGEGSSSGTGVFPGDMVLGGKGGTGPIRKIKELSLKHHRYSLERRQQVDLTTAMRAPTAPITEVTSILFLEVDTTPELNIINQDSTYFTTNLPDESVVTYTSISKQLDYTLPLEEQMEYVPGGVVVVLFGNDEEGNVVQNTVAWDYDLSNCEVEPLAVGDTIGWVAMEDYAPAKAAFCPAVEAPPPTPSPVIDTIETAAPSPSLIEGTESPTAPEVIETKSPTVTELEVIQTTSSTAGAEVETTVEPSVSSKTGKDSSMSYAGKAAKLFKESKSSKQFSTPMSVDGVASKSGKVMSIPEAKAEKKTSADAKAGKDMSMVEAKSQKLFTSKSTEMSVPN